MLKNLTADSKISCFTHNILSGTIIKSDGYPSYTLAVEYSNCIQELVTHSNGFTTREGVLIDFIKIVLAHLKTNLRTKRDVMYKNMWSFVKEFLIFKIYLKRKNEKTVCDFFIGLINSLKHHYFLYNYYSLIKMWFFGI